MAQYPKEKRKPGQDSPIGNLKKILNCKNLSFEYRIATYRGMRPDQFSHALRELFKYGFIDIEQHGRGVKGEWTRFAYSDRWKSYGSPEWQEIPFPRIYVAGFTSEEYKQRRRRELESEKHRYEKPELLTTESRSFDGVEMGDDYGIAELKTPITTDPVTTDSRSPSRSTMPSMPLTADGRIKKKVQGKAGSNSGHSRRITKPKVVFSRRATPEEISSVAAWT